METHRICCPQRAERLTLIRRQSCEKSESGMSPTAYWGGIALRETTAVQTRTALDFRRAHTPPSIARPAPPGAPWCCERPRAPPAPMRRAAQLRGRRRHWRGRAAGAGRARRCACATARRQPREPATQPPSAAAAPRSSAGRSGRLRQARTRCKSRRRCPAATPAGRESACAWAAWSAGVTAHACCGVREVSL